MKSPLLHIIAALMAFFLAACADDPVMPEQPGNQKSDCTLCLIIDDAPMSRGVNSVNIHGAKNCWCYGDKVTLRTNGGSYYHFELLTPDGKNPGDPFTEGAPIFTCTDPDAMPSSTYNNCTGTITYTPPVSTARIDNGYIGHASYEYKSASSPNPQTETCYPYARQNSNDNADHLAGLQLLSATITGMDLSRQNVIKMKRGYSIVKIIIDDIYYPVYGGSTLSIRGLRPVGASAGETDIQTMYLGESIMGTASGKCTKEEYSDRHTARDPYVDKGIIPFCDVSSNKRPFTGYAQRDDDHKIVAYMAFLDAREVRDGDRLTIGLREIWGGDWYFFETDPLKAFSLPLGSLYTIDLSQKAGGRYKYEAYASINLGIDGSTYYGTVATKNLGATSLTDPGHYYMFGYDTYVLPGGHYPKYNDVTPDYTPYYYYKEINGKSYLTLNNIGIGSGQSSSLMTDNLISETYPAGTFTSQLTLDDITRSLEEWWYNWATGLQDLPRVNWATGLQDPSVNTSRAWTVFNNSPESRFSTTYYNLAFIDHIGNVVPLSEPANLSGVRLSNKRTGHAVFFPRTGALGPSEENREHQIMPEATAEIIPGTEEYVSILQYALYCPPASEGKDMQLIAFNIDIATGAMSKKYYPLSTALPVRPAVKEDRFYLEFLLNTIPGAN